MRVVHEEEGVAVHDIVRAQVRSDHHPVLGEIPSTQVDRIVLRRQDD